MKPDDIAKLWNETLSRMPPDTRAPNWDELQYFINRKVVREFARACEQHGIERSWRNRMADPIKFTDDDGVEWEIRAFRAYKLSRVATAEDLALAGYVRGGGMDNRELVALWSLEQHLRRASDRMPYPLRDEVDALLKAIDEARKP